MEYAVAELNVVLDFGKTNSKASLWTADGQSVAHHSRANQLIEQDGFRVLDEAGIKTWLVECLSDFATKGSINAIIPIGHGAAAAIVRADQLVMPPLDYEMPIEAEIGEAYDLLRDPFEKTGSPRLPLGLNLGAQLFALQTKNELIFQDAHVLLWPQYWAWVLSGIMASEVTSLGCHTDLWRPLTSSPSRLAVRQNWVEKSPPLRFAGDKLGKISAHWASLCGLDVNADVYCGLHDSNAALIVGRKMSEFARADTTILSTGTWFVAMRSLGLSGTFDLEALPKGQDCLVNVDIHSKPVPSARFMGGREIELLLGATLDALDKPEDQDALTAGVGEVVKAGAMALPGFVTGTGPTPNAIGSLVNFPSKADPQRTAIALYAALMCDLCLDLIGSKGRLLVEGRFAKVEAFVRALACLRADSYVYVMDDDLDAAFGALSLIEPSLRPKGKLQSIAPLAIDLGAYRGAWRAQLSGLEG
jgi:sugar (pentulose or hexulose) kinase